MINLFTYQNTPKINFDNYTEEQYYNDITTYGIKEVWYAIIKENINKKPDNTSIIHIDNFGMLYELGLAFVNKKSKQEAGIYYTPSDVANVMADFFHELKGENICDVACGTGNLIIPVLNKMDNARDTLLNGNVYLYDNDELALLICRHKIAILFGQEVFDNIKCYCGNFLDDKTVLPSNCKVISNPPYYKIDVNNCDFTLTNISKQCRELYGAFMEKIIHYSKASVLITPYSFLSGNKFSKMRCFLNDYSGYFFSFDNVPGNIFCGNKIGTLSSSNRNSVRTTITVVNNEGDKGFRASQLIRFHNSEREGLLNRDFLYGLLSDKKQIIDSNNPIYCKHIKDLECLYDLWVSKSNSTLAECIVKKFSFTGNDGEGWVVYMPHACRYFTCGVTYPMKRAMRDTIYAKDEKSFYYIHTMLNSSFAYWYWRMFDGGINFSSFLALKMPSFIDVISDEQYQKMKELVDEVIADETKYIVKKMNAGEYQENVKFPIEYRRKFDELILEILGSEIDLHMLDVPYSKTILEVSGVE